MSTQTGVESGGRIVNPLALAIDIGNRKMVRVNVEPGAIRKRQTQTRCTSERERCFVRHPSLQDGANRFGRFWEHPATPSDPLGHVVRY